MEKLLYTVLEVANLLDLHVKTVRNYVREGKLKSTKVGKQYRIAQEDLSAFLGQTPTEPIKAPAPTMDVSAIAQLEGVSRALADRIAILLQAAANGRREATPMRVETIYNPETSRLKIIVVGDTEAAVGILQFAQSLLESEQ